MKKHTICWSAVKENFLRSGLPKKMYQSVKPLVRKENSNMMFRLGILGFLFGIAMSGLSLTDAVSLRVLPAYLFLLVSSGVFLTIQVIWHMKRKTPPQILSYLQMGAMLVYGVLNSSFFAPNPATVGVTFIVLMTLVPFLIIDVPWRDNLLIISSAIFYLVGVYTSKDPSIRVIETTNTVSFCVIACMCAHVFTSRSIQSMADKLYIEKERDTDALTGLSSRHAGEVLIRSLLTRGFHGIFIIMDIDNFKAVNDRYGHPYGDRVLSLVGSAIAKSVRRKDVACRYGGDEFTILLVDCWMEDAHKILKRIRTYIEEEEAADREPVTCSFGLARTKEGEDLSELLIRADEALYRAKRSGKNHAVEAAGDRN